MFINNKGTIIQSNKLDNFDAKFCFDGIVLSFLQSKVLKKGMKISRPKH